MGKNSIEAGESRVPLANPTAPVVQSALLARPSVSPFF